MTIQEMIEKLEKAKAKYGDLPLVKEYGDIGHEQVRWCDLMLAEFKTQDSLTGSFKELVFQRYGDDCKNPTHIQISIG